MRDERGEGRGPKARPKKAAEDKSVENKIEKPATKGDAGAPVEVKSTPSAGLETMLKQIEYLLYQSTQGVHFLFEREDLSRILRDQPKGNFYTAENRDKVQRLLAGLLDARSLEEKRSYLDRKSVDDFELLVRAYFQLVDKAILAHSNLRH